MWTLYIYISETQQIWKMFVNITQYFIMYEWYFPINPDNYVYKEDFKLSEQNKRIELLSIQKEKL